MDTKPSRLGGGVERGEREDGTMEQVDERNH